jgi:hypothetical protein
VLGQQTKSEATESAQRFRQPATALLRTPIGARHDDGHQGRGAHDTGQKGTHAHTDGPAGERRRELEGLLRRGFCGAIGRSHAHRPGSEQLRPRSGSQQPVRSE